MTPLALRCAFDCDCASIKDIMDRWRDGDHLDSKQPGVGMGFAVLLNAVVTVLWATADPKKHVPLRARVDALSWDIQQAMQLLTGKKL